MHGNVDGKFRAAAADVDHRNHFVAAGRSGRAEERIRRFFIAGEDVRLHTGYGSYRRGEIGTVGRTANRARGDASDDRLVFAHGAM